MSPFQKGLCWPPEVDFLPCYHFLIHQPVFFSFWEEDCGGSLSQCMGSLLRLEGVSQLRCMRFSCCRAQALEHTGLLVVNVGSLVAVHGLSCPTVCGILVSYPGTEPIPTLEGGFLTTGSPGKSLFYFFHSIYLYQIFSFFKCLFPTTQTQNWNVSSMRVGAFSVSPALVSSMPGTVTWHVVDIR